MTPWPEPSATLNSAPSVGLCLRSLRNNLLFFQALTGEPSSAQITHHPSPITHHPSLSAHRQTAQTVLAQGRERENDSQQENHAKSAAARQRNSPLKYCRKIVACSTAFGMFTMNRCYFVLLSVVLSSAVLAQGQLSAPLPVDENVVQTGTPGLRKFPASALRGRLKVLQAPDILIDGKPARLSPGSRIRDAQQRLVMSASITNLEFVVNFTRNPLGEVQEVWILNELEAKQKMKTNTPETNVIFASDEGSKKQDDGRTPYNQLPSFEQMGRQQR
jgi:hypothetical protein